ncbi:iron chelate uptake ABC transporter family permease subunit [Streptomyces sp. NPDC058321]|uniref:iron chelate uptake ABC transporter family permease subunit n=1 Tax=Streptomyces sp. NPDC058321 TaxID=3346445 RepID=UPI0036E94631
MADPDIPTGATDAAAGLVAAGLTVAYDDVDVVHEAALHLPKGQVTALIGPNGSGKSTLLRAVARLHRARTGSVTLCDEDGDPVDAPTLSRTDFARRITLLAQSRATPSGLSVREVVGFGRHPYRSRLRGSDPDGARLVERALAVTNVTDLADRGVESLSGGQLQRVWFACCLAQDTEVLLLDEPTTYLDLRHQVEILDLVRDLAFLRTQQTTGLYAWGNGSLAQIGMQTIDRLAPIALLALAGLVVLGRRLDILALGDDGAAVVGVSPRLTRVMAVVLAVALSAVSVTVAGPIGFVGLCAPAIVRLAGAQIPGLLRHPAFVPASAAAGVLVVLGAEVLLRALFGAQAGAAVPTGIVTSFFGAGVLVALAHRSHDAGDAGPSVAFARLRSRRTFVVTLVVLTGALVTAVVASTLLGDAPLLLGDVGNWLTGRSGRFVSFVLDSRMPRIAAAVLAGAALATSGTVVQAVSRNPLAEPGILGVVGGAGVGAVVSLTVVPLASFWAVGGSALAGATAAATLVFGLAARRGLEQNRLVLIGVGVSAGAAALVSLLIVLTDPFNGTKALVWLSGSTYGRTFPETLPVLGALVVALPVLGAKRRELDLIGLDADTPRLLGIRLGTARLGLLAIAVVLTAAAVAAVGVIGFVGLVAPHAARALVGQRHRRVLPVAALLGSLLVVVADTVGRTVIAPAQIPVGVVTAVIGAPYFAWLLWRSKGDW